MTKGSQSQDFYFSRCLSGVAEISIKDGSINLSLHQILDWDNLSTILPGSNKIDTTVEASSLDLYTNTKPSQLPRLFNRAKPLDASAGVFPAIRIGKQIFLTKPDGTWKAFVPKDFSYYIDHIEQHGHYLVATSRQKVTEMPKTTTGGPSQVKKGSARTDVTNSEDINAADADAQASSGPSKDNIDDFSSHDAVKSDQESSVSDEEPSAYESWSEASTDYSSDDQISDFGPQPAPDDLKKLTDPSDTEDSSDASSGTEDSGSSHSHSSDDESIIGDHNRFTATANDSDQEQDMFDDMYNNEDGYHPDRDSEDDDKTSRIMVDTAWEDSGWALFRGQDDYDHSFYAPPSDSEDCSECGDDGTACAMLPRDVTTKAPGDGVSGMPQMPLGMPMAQLHVFDTAHLDNEGSPDRIFRFQCPTINLICDSPPTVHPRKSLVVWPLGDGKILFADYLAKTYFVKRIRFSRMWSQHASIICHFSNDGKHLHVAAFEMQGEPPRRSQKTKKTPGKMVTAAKHEPSQQHKDFDLVVYTYRLSTGKPIRAPPTLICRNSIHLGTMQNVSPTYTWTDDHLHVSCVAQPGRLKVHKINLFNKTSQVLNNKLGSEESLFFKLPSMAADCMVQYLPALTGGRVANPRIIISPGAMGLAQVKTSTDESNSSVTSTEEAAEDVFSAEISSWKTRAWFYPITEEEELSGANRAEKALDLSSPDCWTALTRQS